LRSSIRPPLSMPQIACESVANRSGTAAPRLPTRVAATQCGGSSSMTSSPPRGQKEYPLKTIRDDAGVPRPIGWIFDINRKRCCREPRTIQLLQCGREPSTFVMFSRRRKHSQTKCRDERRIRPQSDHWELRRTDEYQVGGGRASIVSEADPRAPEMAPFDRGQSSPRVKR